MAKSRIIRKPVKLALVPKHHNIRGERDPDLEFLVSQILNKNLEENDIIEMVLDVSNNAVHIRYKTINNWLEGRTLHPQNFTLYWVGLALGYERDWLKTKK